jgi:type VI protein secretion system component VasK
MSGWLHYFTLKAQARTGFSSQVAVWGVIAAVAAIIALVFFLVAAFIGLADRYDPLTAGLVLGGVFVVVALVALIACLVIRRNNMERARRELATRSSANFLDPKLMAMGFQIGQAIGWRRLASLAAVGLLAAGLAKEWLARDNAEAADDDEPTS